MGQFFRFEIRIAGCFIFSGSLNGAPLRRSDRRNKILFLPVTKYETPGNGVFFFFTEYTNAVAQRGEVCIATDVNSVLWARLDAGIAFPAHIGLDVVGPPVGLINVHDIGRADIDAMTATVTTGHIDKGRHDLELSPVTEAQFGSI